jgi:hypothetical protein
MGVNIFINLNIQNIECNASVIAAREADDGIPAGMDAEYGSYAIN